MCECCGGDGNGDGRGGCWVRSRSSLFWGFCGVSDSDLHQLATEEGLWGGLGRFAIGCWWLVFGVVGADSN